MHKTKRFQLIHFAFFAKKFSLQLAIFQIRMEEPLKTQPVHRTGSLKTSQAPGTPNKSVNFKISPVCEKEREKFLTAKYGAHQMSLIRKRLKVCIKLTDKELNFDSKPGWNVDVWPASKTIFYRGRYQMEKLKSSKMNLTFEVMKSCVIYMAMARPKRWIINILLLQFDFFLAKLSQINSKLFYKQRMGGKVLSLWQSNIGPKNDWDSRQYAV